MASRKEAIETIERIIRGQEKAEERIWGKRARTRGVTGTSNLIQNPELAAIAPHHGTFKIPGYTIQRIHCDQLRNFYFWRS